MLIPHLQAFTIVNIIKYKTDKEAEKRKKKELFKTKKEIREKIQQKDTTGIILQFSECKN